MDQFISRLGKKTPRCFWTVAHWNGMCRWIRQVKIVVCDTMKRRGWWTANTTCAEASAKRARLFAGWYPEVKALRDVSSEMCGAHKSDLPETVSSGWRLVGENGACCAAAVFAGRGCRVRQADERISRFRMTFMRSVVGVRRW